MKTYDELLNALKQVSEQLAEWSLNNKCLACENISNDEQKQLERLELILENIIVDIDGDW